MKIAVIDLGTNTCNLLIAKIERTNYQVIHQSKQLVKLGDNSIRNNFISEQAIERTINALKIQLEIIQTNNVDKLTIIGTSAVRSAANRVEFSRIITEKFGWDLSIISGEKEADLIFKGVLLAFGNLENQFGILDIGGGSNEIIIAKNNSIFWKESQPAGMARVINQFNLSDPIIYREVKQLQKFFAKIHKEAFDEFSKNKIQTLIGCSGAFDTIADILDGVNPGEKKRKTQKIEKSDFYFVYNELLPLKQNERMKIKGMDSVRVDLIVPAVIFIEHLISQTGISEIIQTDYALREGVLYEAIY